METAKEYLHNRKITGIEAFEIDSVIEWMEDFANQELKTNMKGIPTRKEIAKFFEGDGVVWGDLEKKITDRWNQALVFHAQMQEKKIKDLEMFKKNAEFREANFLQQIKKLEGELKDVNDVLRLAMPAIEDKTDYLKQIKQLEEMYFVHFEHSAWWVSADDDLIKKHEEFFQVLKAKFCSCEMPSKIKGEDKCFRCKKILI